jgi:hypothetical protein
LLNVPVKDLVVRYNPKKPKVVHELEVVQEGAKPRIFKVEGFGEW